MGFTSLHFFSTFHPLAGFRSFPLWRHVKSNPSLVAVFFRPWPSNILCPLPAGAILNTLLVDAFKHKLSVRRIMHWRSHTLMPQCSKKTQWQWPLGCPYGRSNMLKYPLGCPCCVLALFFFFFLTPDPQTSWIHNQRWTNFNALLDGAFKGKFSVRSRGSSIRPCLESNAPDEGWHIKETIT